MGQSGVLRTPREGSMRVSEVAVAGGHERVVACSDPAADYECIIALHSTRRGPAMGGTRLWPYDSAHEALGDALRLAHAMTYKAALANLGAGGGKAVIRMPARLRSRENLMRAHGRAIESLGGRYVTAMDMGLQPADLEVIGQETRHISLHSMTGGAGGDDTARGVERAMLAAVHHRRAGTELGNLSVAIQGCGNVGAALAKRLAARGVELLVSDIDAERARRVAREWGAHTVSPADITRTHASIYAPCAMGGSLTPAVARATTAEIIAGGANSQLGSAAAGDVLAERGITYVPDFLANAGGIIAGAGERDGWSLQHIHDRVDGIYDTTLRVLNLAAATRTTTTAAANVLAEQMLR